MVAIDATVLAHAEGANDGCRQARARDVIAGLPAGAAIIPVQVLGELFRVLTAKAGCSPARDTSAAALLAALLAAGGRCADTR